MRRAILGAAAGLAAGGGVDQYTGGDRAAAICVGMLLSLTIWFWAWGRISQPGIEDHG
jgi:hypothetical protein